MHATHHVSRLLMIALVALSTVPRVASSSLDPTQYFTLLGDSLSDTGNADFAATSFVKYTGISPDPRIYSDGRFTDGDVWGDKLHKMLPKTQLRWFAVGYATACAANAYHLLQPQIPELPSGQDLAKAYVSVKPLFMTPSKGKVGIWLGANDIGTALLSRRLFNETEVVIQGIISCVLGMTRDLLAAGETVVVFSLPPLEYSPFTQNYKGLFHPLSQAVRMYNGALQQAVVDLKGRAHFLDVYTPLKDVLNGKNAAKYGLKVLKKACVTQVKDVDDVLAPIMGRACSKPHQYAWADAFHLSTVVHQQIIAPLVFKFLQKLP